MAEIDHKISTMVDEIFEYKNSQKTEIAHYLSTMVDRILTGAVSDFKIWIACYMLFHIVNIKNNIWQPGVDTEEALLCEFEIMRLHMIGSFVSWCLYAIL